MDGHGAREDVALNLRRQGHSYRSIGAILGLSHEKVRRDLLRLVPAEPPLVVPERPGNGASGVQDRQQARWRLKACRRCGGDLAYDPDAYVPGRRPGNYVCLQCGATA
jgi:ribosomal protein L40E